uniref:Proteophosphoglycan 5 n=1 Tax=Rhodotorula toruloides TaxID=5286 RepID=A0A0K3CE19_RHOTO
MLPAQITLVRSTLPVFPVPLISPVDVGIDQTLSQFILFLLLNARLVTVERELLDIVRDSLREFCSPSAQHERIIGQASLSRSCEPYILAARFNVWSESLPPAPPFPKIADHARALVADIQCFVSGGIRLGCAWIVASPAHLTRFKRQPSAFRPIAPQNRTLPEDSAVDDAICAVRAALHNYDQAFLRHIERLEAYIAHLSANRTAYLPFETVEAISHTIQRLFQALDAPDLPKLDRNRLVQHVHLLIYLWNLLADPSETLSLALRQKMEKVNPAVEFDCSVVGMLDRKREGGEEELSELFPVRRVLQLVQRIVYIDIPRSRAPRHEPLPSTSPDPAKYLLEIVDVLLTFFADPALDKVDLTSLCMLFYDAYEAHKRLARVEGELWEGIVAFVVARRNWRRAVWERRGLVGP